jgi:transcriptional regulator with XRE-family HTH domain
MHLEELFTDDAVLAELGQRLARHRLARNRTQAELAEEAGIGRATLQRLERGESVQMTSLIRLLRTLGLLGALDAALPETIAFPIAQLERERRPERRRARASGDDAAGDQAASWRWGDEAEPTS